MNVKEFVESVKTGEIDVVKHTEKVLREAEIINSEYNYFVNICRDLAMDQAEKVAEDPKGRLAGVPVSVKDAICVKGVESMASSRILEGYRPVFNATVIRKAVEEGAIIIGKTMQDEFGFGSFSTNVGKDLKTPFNPFDVERSCGGSSGGCAGITQKTRYVHVSLAESTGGSIACPASFCGVYGFTPSYGAVSRYGLMDYGSSLDKIGPMAKSLEDCKAVYDVIKGPDEKDPTTMNGREEDLAPKKFAIVKEAFNVDEDIRETVIAKLAHMGIEYKEVSLPYMMKYSLPAYNMIAMSEASTNLAKYCGLRYGKQPEMKEMYNKYFSKTREDFLGDEAKRRVILGTYMRMAGYRDAYYLKALKLRTLIIKEYKSMFKKYDVLITPTMPILPPRINDVKDLPPLDVYKMDELTVGVNLAGLPHLSVNSGFVRELPVGMMFIADQMKDSMLFKVEER